MNSRLRLGPPKQMLPQIPGRRIRPTIGKFALGLWLALLLNRNLPFKSFLRAILLVPWIVPTVLSALAFWWIYDPQFSIISYVLVDVLHLRTTYIDFLGTPWNARLSLIAANIWRGIPFVAICLLAGLQTISPSLYEAAMIDGATPFQRFRHITFPMLMPILAVVMTFSVIFTFTDFQLVYATHSGGERTRGLSPRIRAIHPGEEQRVVYALECMDARLAPALIESVARFAPIDRWASVAAW